MSSTRSPWATLDDSALGVCAASGSKDAAAREKYLLQAPWTKRGNDKEEETMHIRQALHVRQQRRAENAQRDKAYRSLSQNDNEESLRRAQKYRATRKEEEARDAARRHEDRVRNVNAAVNKQQGLTAEARAEEVADRRRALAEAQASVERKRTMLALEKAAVNEERRRSIEAGQEHSVKSSELKDERRQERMAYKQALADESTAKRLVRAAKLREERLAKDKEKRAMCSANREKKQIRACWMVEEKEEQQNRKEQLIYERAAAFSQRTRNAQENREERQRTQQRVAGEFTEHKERCAAVKAADRKAFREEVRSKRDAVNSLMETRHMRAVERKRLEMLAFQERSVAPLERRAELSRQERAKTKQAEQEYQARVAADMNERKARRGEMLFKDKEIRKQPFALG